MEAAPEAGGPAAPPDPVVAERLLAPMLRYGIDEAVAREFLAGLSPAFTEHAIGEQVLAVYLTRRAGRPVEEMGLTASRAQHVADLMATQGDHFVDLDDLLRSGIHWWVPEPPEELREQIAQALAIPPGGERWISFGERRVHFSREAGRRG